MFFLYNTGHHVTIFHKFDTRNFTIIANKHDFETFTLEKDTYIQYSVM